MGELLQACPDDDDEDGLDGELPVPGVAWGDVVGEAA